MRRCIFANPRSPENSYLRVRDEGGAITCTYKFIEKGELSISSVKEMECVVSDFDEMVGMIREMGIPQKAYQETRREVWAIGHEIEFMIDEWPGLRPFVEIEGPTEAVVREYSAKLGFEYADALFGAVDQVYFQEIGIGAEIINMLPEITFENPPKAAA